MGWSGPPSTRFAMSPIAQSILGLLTCLESVTRLIESCAVTKEVQVTI